MSGSLAGFLSRRLLAVAATVVLAPTVAYTVFGGLSGGNGDRALPLYAVDYAVRTFWHGDLGVSSAYNGERVLDVVLWSLPADLALMVGGAACGLALGVAGGLACALWPGTLLVRALHVLVAGVLSSPPYWLGFMVLVLFAPRTGHLLPVPFVSGLADYRGVTEDPLAWLRALWVPWLLVGLPLAAAVLRMTESALRDARYEDFVRTAHAKGVTERAIVRRHALPLAVAPVAALTGANMAILITNVALVESAFNIPGIYREIQSIGSFADLALLQGMIIETTVVIVVANALADLAHARVDPRVR